MIREPGERIVCIDESFEDGGEGFAVGIEDGVVVETGVAFGCGRGTLSCPGVEADVVMVFAVGDERGRITEPLHHLESEQVAIKPERPIQITHRQMRVPDPCALGRLPLPYIAISHRGSVANLLLVFGIFAVSSFGLLDRILFIVFLELGFECLWDVDIQIVADQEHPVEHVGQFLGDVVLVGL